MLLDVVSRVRDLNIYNLASIVSHQLILWVYETTVRLNVESSVTSDNLSVEFRVNLNGVGLNKSLTSLVVTLRLDTLKLEKRNAKITLLIPKFFNKFLYILPG